MAAEKEIAVFADKIHSFDKNDQQRILSAVSLAEAPASAPGAAVILLDLGLDADTIIAALLLNVLRENKQSVPDQFGPGVKALADGVKKIDSLHTNNKTIQEAENIRNMLLALTDDIRVILIKLAEKLHTLRLLDSCENEDERKLMARESVDIYAPLAGRLGISWLKNEMEDLSLKFLNRDTYQQIKNIVAEKRGQRSLFLEYAQQAIKNEAEAAGLKIEVKSRAKHFYSVYMKMRKRGKSDSEIHDLSAIRIICDSIETCYTLLGIIHRLWEPLSGCFDDYIAKPKPNGYQSLHTTVLAGTIKAESGSELFREEKPLEIQIRTKEMHQMAENGVASHWLYKKGLSREAVDQHDIEAANHLKNWQQEEGHKGAEISGVWLQNIKQEIFRKSVYVFTPQGKVVKLPKEATPVDFAFHIHTAVGEHCIGAKANGSIIPLNSQLKNTQVVEILTSPSAHPSLNWLRFVKSSKARSKIRSWLEKNDEAFATDKSAEKNTAEKKKPAEMPVKAMTVKASPPVLAGAQKESHVQTVVQPLSSVLQVRIEDEKNMMVRYARCCKPFTGDPIVGYVSRGRGIIIHRKNCPCLASNPEFETRKIEAQWENKGSAQVKRFRIEAKFSANLFSEIEGAIRRRQGHLIEGRLEETAQNRLAGFFTIQLVKDDDLKPVMKNIRGIPGIINIQQIN